DVAYCNCTCIHVFQVAWLRVDTQTILTIATHVITKNHRIGVTHSDHRTWYLQIRDVRESDRGWYMCQINTDPMKSQVGYLEVVGVRSENINKNCRIHCYLITTTACISKLYKNITILSFTRKFSLSYVIVPPDILDYPTSTDMVVREGTNVTLRCAATGSPQPNITWRREGGEPIPLGNGQESSAVMLILIEICFAISVPPMIWIQNQLVGAHEGQQMTLECNSEAYPKSINYWTREKGEIIAQGGKYEPVLLDNAYKVHMKLTIRSVGPADFGSYKCVSKNSLGDTDGSIKLYRIPHPSTPLRTMSTTEASVAPEIERKHKTQQKEEELREEEVDNEIVENPEKITKERDLKLRGRPRDNALELPVAEGPTSSAGSALPQTLLIWFTSMWLSKVHVPPILNFPP
ncbi:hypothetical protein C0J52_02936, partial [Blattella germanica]